MKSYFDLETFDDLYLLELGNVEELSCSCFRSTCLFVDFWYCITPLNKMSIYINKGDETIELAPTWIDSAQIYNGRKYK